LKNTLTRCLLLGIFALAANAGIITTVNSRAELGANDLLEWGSAADDTSGVLSPYQRTSIGGLDVTATLANGFTIYVQDGAAFVGNFTPGEILLDTAFSDGPVVITFANAIRGIGFNIQHMNLGAFTGQIDFYGAGDVLFGSVAQNGNSNFNNDGSAVFLGGTSSARDITRIDVSVGLLSGGSGFTINQASLLTTNAATPGEIPEPATVTLVSAALGGLIWLRRRRG
jgi:hypothetical protein